MKRHWHFALLEIQLTNHSICRNFDGLRVGNFTGGTMTSNTASGNISDDFQITFGGGNSALFNINSSTSNTLQGYNTTGTPAIGVGTNTGSGNGGGNNDF